MQTENQNVPKTTTDSKIGRTRKTTGACERTNIKISLRLVDNQTFSRLIFLDKILALDDIY